MAEGKTLFLTHFHTRSYFPFSFPWPEPLLRLKIPVAAGGWLGGWTERPEQGACGVRGRDRSCQHLVWPLQRPGPHGSCLLALPAPPFSGSPGQSP